MPKKKISKKAMFAKTINGYKHEFLNVAKNKRYIIVIQKLAVTAGDYVLRYFIFV